MRQETNRFCGGGETNETFEEVELGVASHDGEEGRPSDREREGFLAKRHSGAYNPSQSPSQQITLKMRRLTSPVSNSECSKEDG